MNEDQNRQAWYVLFVLFAINMMNFFDRQIAASVAPLMITEFKLSDSDYGDITTAFILVYAAVGVPLGRWADRGSRPFILGLGATFWSLFTAASGLARGYWSLFAMRIGVGIGEASCAPAGNSLIGDMFPPNRRARAMAIFMLGLPIGIFLSNMLGGMIAQAYGWRTTFFIAAIPGFIFALMSFRIKEVPRGASEAVKVSDRPDHVDNVSPYRRVLSIPTMWWIILAGALHNFNAYAVNAYMPLYLVRYYALDLKTANFIAAVVLGAVGVVGLLAGGLVADWIRKWRDNGRMLLAALSLLVSTPLIFLALSLPKDQMIFFTVLMGLGWLLFYIYYVTVYPAIQDVVEPHLRGTAMALYFFAMYVLGGAFGSKVVGMLSDNFALRAAAEAGMIFTDVKLVPAEFRAIGLHQAFYSAPVISLLLAAVLFAGARTVTGDMEKLRKRMLEAVGVGK
ncbi:MAG: MFS transporter [Acidobacteria bacterium]|nr:MFS transporter [Acidobacteriota bacterium]